VQKAGFIVLKSPDIPSILVETAFISNPSEEQNLLTAGYQNKMANAILKVCVITSDNRRLLIIESQHWICDKPHSKVQGYYSLAL